MKRIIVRYGKMNKTTEYLKKPKGFTLVELLVVIAIIALLLAVIMPSLGKAKSYALEVVCKSNLHQYQIATEVYTNENKDWMPDPWESLYAKIQFSGESQRYCRWHNPDYNLDTYADKQDNSGTRYAGPYWPYLASTKASICPIFAKLATKYGVYHMEGNGSYTASDCIGGPFVPQFSYSMNTIFYKQVNSQFVPVRKTQVRSPSQTFLWAEENMWPLSGLSGYVLNDNALLVDGSNIRDCFASYHKISLGKLGIQQSTHEYESGTGVANVLMVDGSLTWATPEDSSRYEGSVR